MSPAAVPSKCAGSDPVDWILSCDRLVVYAVAQRDSVLRLTRCLHTSDPFPIIHLLRSCGLSSGAQLMPCSPEMVLDALSSAARHAMQRGCSSHDRVLTVAVILCNPSQVRLLRSRAPLPERSPFSKHPVLVQTQSEFHTTSLALGFRKNAFGRLV